MVAWTAVGRIAGFALVALVVALGTVATAAPNVGPGAAQASPAASPVAAEAVELTGLVERPGPVTAADLQRLPAETVDVSYEAAGRPERHTFTGVRLYAVLDAAGLVVGPDERNPLLSRYLVITANDGYQIVLSGGELDPNFGDAPILLAWEQDGQPLTGHQGPMRLVVPGDKRGGRYIYGIVRIEVRGIAGTPVPGA